MTPIFITLSYWLHALATVVFVGHFVLLAAIYLPALADTPTALSAISKQSRKWLYVSLLVFTITGLYLTFVDSNYLGIGKFNNFWSMMMLVKHLLIVVMIAMGFWFNAIIRVGPLMSSNTGAALALTRFRWYVNAMAICGVLVLLFTALAQAN
ncbi:MAG: hypothetical protein QY332_16040 [Anaerolineales bacterium]|nr:MAG: hypothetical protein QY332_16040 [Anaerolineales bacterium]